MMDLIERQAAIEAVHKNYDTILDFKSDGHTVADSFEDIINALPSAQTEIIRCRDCKHYYFADNRIPQEQRYVCDLDGDRWKPDDYCSFAERMRGGKQE